MKTIFIVDDNDAALLLVKNALDGIYETYAFPSAAGMFKLMEKIRPDLILLDVAMPEMDGFEVIRIMKASDNFKDIPVIFLTAKCDTESEISGLELGAHDYIRKPFSPAVLIKRIEKHIEIDNLMKELRCTQNSGASAIENIMENNEKSAVFSQEERKIAVLLTEGLHQYEIARKLHLSSAEVGEYIRNIRDKVILPDTDDPLLNTVIAKYKLTRREIEMLKFLRRCMTNSEIAKELCISEETVKTHIHNLLRKLNVANRLELTEWLSANSC